MNGQQTLYRCFQLFFHSLSPHVSLVTHRRRYISSDFITCKKAFAFFISVPDEVLKWVVIEPRDFGYVSALLDNMELGNCRSVM